MAFHYEGLKYVADFYLLGHARKTGAYVVGAWCLEPEPEYRAFRYSLIKHLEPVGEVESYRADFDPEALLIISVDTRAPFPRPQRHN
jgi:hypothetical protein